MDVPAAGASGGSQNTFGYVDLPPQPHSDVVVEAYDDGEPEAEDEAGGYMEVGP